MPSAIRIPSLRLTELDGSPDVLGVEQIYLTNGNLTNMGAGKALLSLSGAASGDSTTTAAYVSRPSPSNDGNLFLPNNSFYLERDTGAAFESWGPIFPLTPPIDGDFAWINQNGASVSTTKGGVFLSSPSSSGIRLRKKAAPSTPYTIQIGFITPVLVRNSFNWAGAVFRESSSGKLHVLIMQAAGGGISIGSHTFTDPTTFSGTYTSIDMESFGPMIFLEISDDGANRICRVCLDGQNTFEVHSVARTNFLTADEVGFAVSPGGTYPISSTFLHWKQS